MTDNTELYRQSGNNMPPAISPMPDRPSFEPSKLVRFTTLDASVLDPKEYCSICFRSYDNLGHIPIRVFHNGQGCVHLHGHTCLQEWVDTRLERSRECPVCRESIEWALEPRAPTELRSSSFARVASMDSGLLQRKEQAAEGLNHRHLGPAAEVIAGSADTDRVRHGKARAFDPRAAINGDLEQIRSTERIEAELRRRLQAKPKPTKPENRPRTSILDADILSQHRATNANPNRQPIPRNPAHRTSTATNTSIIPPIQAHPSIPAIQYKPPHPSLILPSNTPIPRNAHVTTSAPSSFSSSTKLTLNPTLRSLPPPKRPLTELESFIQAELETRRLILADALMEIGDVENMLNGDYLSDDEEGRARFLREAVGVMRGNMEGILGRFPNGGL